VLCPGLHLHWSWHKLQGTAPYFKGGKPVILYVCGQTFNLILTIAMAYVMFYLVFPEITAKI
jgi:hypothetical protein